MIVVTAGHVDHGKTSLVKSLTGTDTDRLPEEKKRGLSIDLGFAYLARDGSSGAGEISGASAVSSTNDDLAGRPSEPGAPSEQIAFVDVPGHEKFVRNMIAGVSAVDAALLVIAADDGPMPQTREHLSILQLLGVPRIIVAISKVDLVDGNRISQVKDEIANLLADTRFSGAQMIDVSVADQASVDRVKAALLDDLSATVSQDKSQRVHDSALFRMCIDRRFSVTGAGTVVTGTVTSGAVHLDQEIYSLTGQVPLRVRGIHAQSKAADRAVAGQRCALNIVGTELKRAQLERGEWLSENQSLQAVSYFDVSLTPSLSDTTLKHWTPGHFHVGASDIPCRIALLDVQQAAAGESVYARILCDKPAGVVHGDRFVLRDQSARQTIAGGIVVDPLPPRRGRSRPDRLKLLKAMRQPTRELALQQLINVARGGVSINHFAQQFNLHPRTVLAMTAELPGVVVTQPDADAWALPDTHVAELKADIYQSLQSWHELHTDALGADVEQLRRHMSVKLARPVLVDLLRHLSAEKKLVRRGAVYRVAGRESSLSADNEQLWTQLQPLYRSLAPVAPRVVEVAEALDVPPADALSLLNSLVAHGRLYKVSENRYFLPADLLYLAKIAEQLAAEERLTVAGYRDESGIGRNLVVELLEFFDRVQLTRRLGQQRRLLRSAEQVFSDN